MTLSAGTRLGPYEIVSQLGAGGMGEVYKATDTRLGRTVAIKILHQASEHLRERFEREARVVAALQHPHICTLFDIGNHEGMDYLVMEYLEGQTLQCPLPLAKVLEYGMEISDALDAAHRKGVTHRDLKPANVMITRTGAKLLDFGIAKLNEAKHPGPDDATLTLALTAGGTIIGTLPYMAPEQIEGKQADPRSDIWAFGALLHEMVSGKRAFDGKTQVGLIAAILEHEPPPVSPPGMEKVIRRCLAKEPDRRWQSALDIKLELESIQDAPAAVAVPEKRASSKSAWLVAAVAVVMAAGLAGVLLLQKPVEQPTIGMQVHPMDGESFAVAIPMISPDGRKLAYTALAASGKSRIRIRSLDSVTTQALPETDNALNSFWSPDSRFLGFFADGKLKKIDVTGGPPQTLCDATRRNATGTWSRAGVIVFREGSELKQVSPAGGVPVPLVIPDSSRGETIVDFPQFLPDGRRFLYSVSGKERGIYWGSLDSKNPKERNLVMAGTVGAVFALGSGSSGRLLFLREGTLMAEPFELSKLQLSGDPVPVVQSISTFGPAAPMVSASDNGVLAYSTGIQFINTQLSWFSREGKPVSNVGVPVRNFYLTLSPEEKRVAVSVSDSSNSADLWIHDMGRGAFTRLTFDPAFDNYPVWSPDGQRIVFFSNRGGKLDLYVKAASGAGEDEPLFQSPYFKLPTDWSRDGRHLLFSENDPKSKHDLWTLEMEKRKATLFLKTEFNEQQGQFSPDGRWIAYVSDESKDFQVYVRSFPPSGGRWQVSLAGGTQPRWRGDGKELYFISRENKVMAVPVKLGVTVEPGTPKELFLSRIYSTGGVFGFQYAVSRDGQRFLINSSLGDGKQDPITVVVNWK